MIFLVCAILTSLVVSSIGALSDVTSSTNVTFQRDNTTKLCEEGVVIFILTIVPEGRDRQEYRLDCTITLYTEHGSQLVGEGLPLVDFKNVSSFFGQLKSFVERHPLSALHSTVRLTYRFDTSNGNCNFSLVANGTVLISYMERNGTIFQNISENALRFNGTLEPYLNDTNLYYLKNYKESLNSERQSIYTYVQGVDNSTNVYELYYNERNDSIVCLITADAMLNYLVLINGRVVGYGETNYNDMENTYTTGGSVSRGSVEDFECRIIFPNGMVAVKKFHMAKDDSKSQTTTILQITTTNEDIFELDATTTVYSDTFAASRTVIAPVTTTVNTEVEIITDQNNEESENSTVVSSFVGTISTSMTFVPESDVELTPSTPTIVDYEDETKAAKTSASETASTVAIVVVIVVIILIASALVVNRRRVRRCTQTQRDIL